MFGVLKKTIAILVCVMLVGYVFTQDCCSVPNGIQGVSPEECSAYMASIGCDFYYCASCSCGPSPNMLYILGCDETFNPCGC